MSLFPVGFLLAGEKFRDCKWRYSGEKELLACLLTVAMLVSFILALLLRRTQAM